MKILLKNARILKMDDTPIFLSSLVIIDDHIAYIGDATSKYAPFDQVHDCHGNVIMPGFKNAHSHSGMTFLRSKTDGHNLHDWLFDVVFPREKLLTPEDVYAFSKVAFLEYLTSGITACFDQYFFPPSIAKAAREIGMRTLLLGTYNRTYTASKLKELYHEYNDPADSLVRYCFGIHAEYTASEEEVAQMKKIIHEEKAPFFIHLSETKSEVDDCYQRRGISPATYLEQEGLFDFGGGAYHCLYLNEVDVEIFSRHHLSLVTCPGSNAKLADGIIPLLIYKQAGLNIALGTDGPASNNCLDMFKEMSLTYSLNNLLTGDLTSLSAYDILKMATVNGAKAMRLSDCDILDVDKKADLIEIDLLKPNMQPLNDIVSNIVYSGSKDNIKMTMINGRILYLDGKFFLGQSLESIYHNAQLASERIEKDLQK